MPNKRIAMRKIHEILRLRFAVGLPFLQISQCTDVSCGAIQKMLKRLEASWLSWPLPERMPEPRLASLLYPEPDSRPGSLEDPDWAVIHIELRKKGVTRHLLWEEYCQRMSVRVYSYSLFCCRYQAWCLSQKRSMCQQHLAGEKCFIDYCGPQCRLSRRKLASIARRRSSKLCWVRQITPGSKPQIRGERHGNDKPVANR